MPRGSTSLELFFGTRWAAFVVVLLLCGAAHGVDGLGLSLLRNLGGTYTAGDQVSLFAGSVTSHSKVLPLRWSSVFPCAWSKAGLTVAPAHRNIGQILMGDVMVDSGIVLNVLENTSCGVICSVSLGATAVKQYESRVRSRYHAHLFLDGLPVLDASRSNLTLHRIRTGFPLGEVSGVEKDSPVVIYNHFQFTVSYYPVTSGENTLLRIVRFEMHLHRVRHTNASSPGGTCQFVPMTASEALAAPPPSTFSYSVTWVSSAQFWKARWDNYVDRDPRTSKVHWYSIANGFSLVLLQSAVLGYILLRSVRRDISWYNEEDLLGDREDSGWRLVHGDVFRPPRGAVILALLVGNGVQLTCMAATALLLAVLGIVSPDSRGRLTTLLLSFFVFFSSANGFVTAALIKFFRRRSWHAILLTSVVLPGFCMVVYLMLNFIHLGSRAASALPFSSLLYLLVLWLCISIPLCFGGAVAGFSTHISIPVKINAIPRTTPPQPWYMKGPLSYLAFGIFPFAASYVELQSIFSSMWLGTAYHMFPFLIIAFALVLVIVAQTSILATYHRLSLLNYHWWWHSFIVSSSYGVWLMMYCVFYYCFISPVKGILATTLFFGYMSLVCVVASLMFGAAGFIASLAFVRKLYFSVKVD